MRAKRYVQSLTIETPLIDMLQPSRGMRPAYDGVAEVWFDSVESAEAAGFAKPGAKSDKTDAAADQTDTDETDGKAEEN